MPRHRPPSTLAPFLATARRTAEEIVFATTFLTRLPLRFPNPSFAPDLLPRTMTWFPLVGVLVGLVTGLVFLLASTLGATPTLAGWLALVATIALTGGLHEDGLADSADGLGGGKDREAKLAIMRDSRVGSYGVIALVASLGLRAAAVAAVAQPELVLAVAVAAASLSRAAMVLLTGLLAPARRDGLGAAHGRPSRARRTIALGLALVIALATLGPLATLAAAALTGLVMLVLAWLARRHLDGYTGDILGALQQSSELVLWLYAALTLHPLP